MGRRKKPTADTEGLPGTHDSVPEVRDDLGSSQEGLEGSETSGTAKAGTRRRMVDGVLQEGVKKRRKRVDPEKESKQARVVFRAIHQVATGQNPPQDQEDLNADTVGGYAEEYGVAFSRYVLHLRAVIGGLWFLGTLFSGMLSRLKRRAQNHNGTNGLGENVPGGEGNPDGS